MRKTTFGLILMISGALFAMGCGSNGDGAGGGGDQGGGGASPEPLRVVAASLGKGALTLRFNGPVPIADFPIADFRTAEIAIDGAYQGLQNCGDSDSGTSDYPACRSTCIGYAVDACPEDSACCTVDVAADHALMFVDSALEGPPTAGAENELVFGYPGSQYAPKQCLPVTLHYRPSATAVTATDGRKLAAFGVAKLVTAEEDVEILIDAAAESTAISVTTTCAD